MSEQPAAGAQGKKYAGLTRNQWLITGGVFITVLAYLVIKRRQAAAASSNTGAASQGSNECTDANGSPVDCNQAFAQELADMANALDQLQAQQGGGTGGGSGVTGTVGTGDGSTGTTTTTQPAGTPVTSGGATATKTASKTAGMITGLKTSHVTKTSFTASWNAAANATGYAYIVRDLASHTQITQGQTGSTTVTVSGLKPGVDYNFGVQGLPGGTGANIHVRTA